MYKSWPRITEQTHIADRQHPLSTSGKRTHIPGSLAFQRALATVDRVNERRDIGMHVRPLLCSPMEKQQKKPYEKTTLLVIRYRLIISTLCFFFGYPLLARMVKCRSSSIKAATILMLVTVTTVRRTLPCSSNSADSRPSTTALCHCWIVKSSYISFPNASFNNVVVSLGVFFMRTQNLIAQRCSVDTSIFSKYSATHCLAIHECSASYDRFLFFLRVDCCTHLLLHSRTFYRPSCDVRLIDLKSIIWINWFETDYVFNRLFKKLVIITLIDYLKN